MVNDLELQAAMKPIKPFGGGNIHGCAKGFGGEVLVAVNHLCRHSIVRNIDLQVKDRGSNV